MASSSRSASHQIDAEKESRSKISAVADAYDAVIHANTITEQKYRAEEAILLKRLHEIQAELRDHKGRLVKTESEKHDFFRYYSVGKPYFKDKNHNHPPDNDDTVIMKQYQMYDFSNVMTVSGWTVGDKTRLLAVLLDLSKDIIKRRLETELTTLRRIKAKTKQVSCKINKLMQELKDLKHKTLEDLDLPTDQEFDWEEVALKLNKRHSSREYKAIWDLFFHPRVNKSAWGHKEHQELQQIAAEKNMQDWESIARALNNGRTGYQCFVYFRTNVNHAASGRKWTQSEMNYLQRVIDLYKEENYIPWGKVAASMQNRTKIQCYNKHLRMIEGRKGRFLPEEDSVILNFVNVYGTDFRKMSSFLAGRSAMQLRVRYNLLLKIRVSTTWSVDDDRKLLQIMANQDSRTNFSTATKHFPGKDRQNIRSRYNTLIRWMKSHPHSDISTAPRRAARRLPHGAPSASLVRALDALRDRMQAELQRSRDDKIKQKSRKLTRDATDAVIRDSLMITVANIEARQLPNLTDTLEGKVDGSYRTVQVRDVSSTPEERANLFNAKCFLILLNAKLNDERFRNSAVGRRFEEIENRRPEDWSRLKSYSKTDVTIVEPFVEPTLFGTIAGRKRFLVPPNFATVTGSRVILSLLSGLFAKEKSDINLKMLARRNCLLNEALTHLRERFIDLFTWAYILSNEPPEYYKLHATAMAEWRANAKPFVQRPLPDVPAVTIPPPPPRRLRQNKVNDNIDADAMEVDETKVDIEDFARPSDMFKEGTADI